MSTKRSDLVSASEIASWEYCPESWRLEALGKEPENKHGLARGKTFHSRTARAEVWSRRAVKAGVWLLLFALVLGALGYVFLGGVER